MLFTNYKKEKLTPIMHYLIFLEKRGLRVKSLGLKDASAVTQQYVCAGNKGKEIEDFSSEKVFVIPHWDLSKNLSQKKT